MAFGLLILLGSLGALDWVTPVRGLGLAVIALGIALLAGLGGGRRRE